MKRILLLCSTLLLLTSCFERRIPITDEDIEIYNYAKSFYPEIDVMFLPDLTSGKLLYFECQNSGIDCKSCPRTIRLLMQYSKSEMDSIRMNLDANTIRKYSFGDEHLLILDYDPKVHTHFKNLKLAKDTLDICPIPNFDFLQNRQLIGNYKKAEIYVFGCAHGAIIDKELLRSDRAGLPESWKHGMTKGVTIWNNYVAYWFEVW